MEGVGADHGSMDSALCRQKKGEEPKQLQIPRLLSSPLSLRPLSIPLQFAPAEQQRVVAGEGRRRAVAVGDVSALGRGGQGAGRAEGEQAEQKAEAKPRPRMRHDAMRLANEGGKDGGDRSRQGERRAVRWKVRFVVEGGEREEKRKGG